jgi:hypothetical protein
MVSVCATCKGLQRHLNPSSSQESEELGVVQWVNATLPRLRQSTSGGCRACALLLQGILLHHDRFTGVKEERVRIVAQSYRSDAAEKAQDHLSVDVRWTEQPDECGGETAHDHEDSYPDLRLEFFTDGGMYFLLICAIADSDFLPLNRITCPAYGHVADYLRWTILVLSHWKWSHYR